jgi:subtilisin
MAAKDEPAASPPQEQPLAPRKEQYLIAHKPAELLPQGVPSIDLSALEEQMKAHPNIDFKRTLKPQGVVSVMAAGTPGAAEIMVAAMPPSHAEMLDRMPQLVVEEDAQLDYQRPDIMVDGRDPGTLMPTSDQLELSFVVRGSDGVTIPGATVYVFGRFWPYQGVTDATGSVKLTLLGEVPDGLKAVYVRPEKDYWSMYFEHPAVSATVENAVTVPTLGSTIAGFPDKETLGWGEKAMRIDQLPPTQRGKGARVAVIDSGAASAHPDLTNIQTGFDVTVHDPTSWNVDTVGHGSHCAGVIAGHQNGHGIVGIAPEAEVHVYKIFPGGRFSDLLEAIDYCISDQIDVVNMSLGSPDASQLVEAKLELAKTMGVACIVAAGNSSGPVQNPGQSSAVLTVSAIGKTGEYPPESWHATQVAPNTKTTAEGYFAAKFSCFGPEVGVCGPGVGIVSSVPPSNYEAMDGTSMAAPHVTGLAALVVAHHPDFQGRFKARSPERVERLFEILKQSARPLDVGDANRVGVGLPDAVNALRAAGQQPGAGSGGGGGGGGAGAAGAAGVTAAGISAADQAALAAAAAARMASIQKLESLMKGAGLMPAGVVAPQSVGPPVGPGPSPRPTVGNGGPGGTVTPQSADLQELSAMMGQAGLGGEGAPDPQGEQHARDIVAASRAALDQLKQQMARAGL